MIICIVICSKFITSDERGRLVWFALFCYLFMFIVMIDLLFLAFDLSSTILDVLVVMRGKSIVSLYGWLAWL